MPDPIRRKNHYVPEWYQQGFLKPGQSQLYYLDKHPEAKSRPDGGTYTAPNPIRREPGGLFCEQDLYTTQFGPILNDEIERLLFGQIDDSGARAVRAYIGGDQTDLITAFEDFFVYLDAQKLRTPKGLDWIKSRYQSLNQVELMVEMQGLRLMHCTMWSEGVREIVTADSSDIKFLVSDHPVTIYNAALSPESKPCEYPNDPPIEMIGSQTVFVLDENTCLILTHLECAKQGEETNLLETRTHARYAGRSFVKADALVRKRSLNSHVSIRTKTTRRSYPKTTTRSHTKPATDSRFKDTIDSRLKTATSQGVRS